MCDTSFQYDVHSLMKAFFPEEDVHIESNEAGEDFTGFQVCYGQDSICCFLSEQGTVKNRMEGNISDLERSEVKNVLKQTLYSLLSSCTGTELPWGTLTGIRPTKIPMKMLFDGEDEASIYRYMKDTYYVSDDKIRLATEIAVREKAILSNISEDGYSLYVGIPFCPTTCLYCSFTSYPIGRFHKYVDTYLATLEKEMIAVSQLMQGKRMDSVYIGGGTPTTLTAEQLSTLVGMIRTHFDLSDILEFTVEAGRPDSISFDKLKTLKDLGVSRISINPQTMNDTTLKIIGRNHTVDQIRESFAAAREAGHDNINMDIILGLPGENEEMVAYTLREIAKLKPDSLTVHSMAIKRAAGMHRFLEEHQDITSVNTPAMMTQTEKAAKEMGLNPYYLYRQKNMAGNFENVGYAREGKYGIYNILIMEEVQSIVALGAGTVTKRVFGNGRIERCDNVKDALLYMDKIDEMIERKVQLFNSL